jgi:D-threo-aldose 1-dehydrogenase
MNPPVRNIEGREIAVGAARLGFGVGGAHGRLTPRSFTTTMVRQAFSLGVRLFDTSPSYGAGEAESRLGEAIASLPREKCIISTKAGITSPSLLTRSRDFSPDGLRRSLEASLKRLRIDKLDWFFLHGPSTDELVDDKILAGLSDIKASGLVREVGVAGRGLELDFAMNTGIFTVYMAPVHASLAPEERERLARIRATGAELIGFEALAPSQPRYPAPTSFGAAWRLARNLATTLGRAPTGAGEAQPVTPVTTRLSAEASLRWTLTEGGADRVVISTTRLAHLQANVATAESAPALA